MKTLTKKKIQNLSLNDKNKINDEYDKIYEYTLVHSANVDNV